jgi:hypothetical protein
VKKVVFPIIYCNSIYSKTRTLESCSRKTKTSSVLLGLKKIWDFEEKSSGPCRLCGRCVKSSNWELVFLTRKHAIPWQYLCDTLETEYFDQISCCQIVKKSLKWWHYHTQCAVVIFSVIITRKYIFISIISNY